MTALYLHRLTACRAAALAGILLVLAQPVRAADFDIDNLKLDFGKLVVTAPKITVKGSPIERDAFIALFNSGSSEPVAARMGRFNAAEITASEFNYEVTLGPEKQITSYRDIRFTNIRDGKIGHAAAERGTFRSEGGQAGPVTGSIAQSSFTDFDLRHVARIFTERAAPGTTEAMVPFLGRLDQGAQTFTLGTVGTVSVGKASTRGLAARVGTEPLAEVITKLVADAQTLEKAGSDAKSDLDAAQIETSKRLGLSLLSLFENIEYGSGEMRDFAMKMTVPADAGKRKSKAADKPVAIDFKIARVGYGEDTPAKSGFVLEGLQFSGGGAAGVIDSASHSGFAMGNVIKELRTLLSSPDADLDAIDYRKFIPTIGTFRLAGISVDAPQEAKRGQPAPPPLKVGLGAFELKADEQLNGVPTALSLKIDNLRAPVTEGTGNPSARDLIAMGYKALDLSAGIDLAWDAARNELAIKGISLSGADMGKFSAKGILGNVTKDVFSSDLALAQVAALGATARSVEATLQNSGLFEKLIENEARKAKRKPDEVRQQYAMMATLGLASILGPSDAAKALTASVSRFVAKPGTLSIQASAKASGGLGLADVITMGDPTEIFDKIDLKASAE